MNICSNSYTTNFTFQKRIKMNPANTEKLIKSTLVASGVGSIAAGLASADTVFGPTVYGNTSGDSIFNPELAKSTEASLLEHAPQGVPAQSTAIPSALSYLGSGTLYLADKVDKHNKQIPS